MSTPEYRKEKYDNVSFKVSKGKAEEYRQAARDFGIAQSEMFRQAVETFIAERSLQDLPVTSTPKSPPTACHALMEQLPVVGTLLSKEQRLLLDEFNQLPVDTQKAIVKLIRSVNAQSRTDN